jgi:hypothetical protein
MVKNQEKAKKPVAKKSAARDDFDTALTSKPSPAKSVVNKSIPAKSLALKGDKRIQTSVSLKRDMVKTRKAEKSAR